MKSQLIINHSSFTIGKSRGFTLIEVAVTTGIIAILLGFITINLVGSQQKADLTAHEQVLISDLKSQQIKAMVGDASSGSSDSFGIHFDQDKYTLFRGTSYNVLEPSNFAVNLDSNMEFDMTATAINIIFARITGEIGVPATVELENNITTETRTIQINRLGVITEVESL